MKIIILAAGRGSRLGKRTNEIPKCMCTLAGKTLLDRCLNTLVAAGVNKQDIGIVTGYKSELFQEDDVYYFHNENWSQTNMFYSLTMAQQWLQKEPCIVCYSDIVFSSNAIKSLIDTTEPLAITYYTEFLDLWKKRMEDPLDDLESFRIERNGYLLEIGKKPKTQLEIQGQYMGLIRFTPESWDFVNKTIKKHFPDNINKLDMTSLLQVVIEDGYPISTIAVSDLWLECDTEQDIDLYEKEFAGLI